MRSTTTLDNAATPASSARGVAACDGPSSVIRGAKSHNTICIDWLRLSGPRCVFYEVMHLLEDRFGKPELGKGRFFLDTGYHWAEGGMFLDLDADRKASHCVIELPGKLISELDFAQVRQLLHDLYCYGFKATRIDIALDLYDHPDLITIVRDSCNRGELCRSRTYQHIVQRSGPELTAHGINIGQRGKKGSGRYLRVYDKGLEQKTRAAGEWIRWEVELSDSCAQQFAHDLAINDDPVETAVSNAVWVVEFREKTGARMLSRRPLAEWFEQFTQHVRRERLTADRAKSTVESYARWVRTAVVPKLETIARITRTPLGGVISFIAGEVAQNPDHANCPKVRTIVRSMGVDPRTIKQRLSSSGEVCRHA